MKHNEEDAVQSGCETCRPDPFTLGPDDPRISYRNNWYAAIHGEATLYGEWLNPHSFNRYLYCNNNPVSFVDPLGLYEYDTQNTFKAFMHEMNPVNTDGTLFKATRPKLDFVGDVIGEGTYYQYESTTEYWSNNEYAQATAEKGKDIWNKHGEFHKSLENKVADTVSNTPPMSTVGFLEGGAAATSLGGTLTYGSGSLLAGGTTASVLTGTGLAVLGVEAMWCGVDILKGTAKGLRRKAAQKKKEKK